MKLFSFLIVFLLPSITFSQELSVNATATPETICYGDATQLEAIASGGTGTYTYSWSSVPVGFTSTIYNPVVLPLTTTTYIVIVDDGTNTDTSEVTVTVNTLPIADAGTDVSICEGSATTLTATGGGIYEWSTGDNIAVIIVQPSDTTIYTVTVTNSCGNDYDSVIVYVNTLPVVDLGPDTSIVEDSAITLDAGAGFISYIWSIGDITQTITISEEGTYSVTVTDINGCNNLDEITITVIGASVNTVESESYVNIYPNPNEGTFALKIVSQEKGEVIIKIYNIHSQLVYLKKLSKVSNELLTKIDISEYAKSFYHLKIITNSEVINKIVLFK